MPTYQPNIPTGTVDLDQDYLNLQGNFQQLDIVYGTDHVPYSTTTNQGYHTEIHFVPTSTTATNPPNNQPITPVVATPGFGQIFSAQINDTINTDEALYFLSGGNRLTQLTRNFQPVVSSNGYTFLPGGLMIQWGVVANPGTSGTVLFVTNNIDFGTSLFNVQLTGSRSGTFGTAPTAGVFVVDFAATFDNTTFSYKSSTPSTNALYWIALGV